MIPGDTARPFVGVWGASGPCITPSNLPRVLDLGCFAPNLALPSWGFWCVAMERGGSTHDEGSFAGCPRTPLDLPWAFDAGAGPSYCMAHRCVSSADPKLVTGRPGSSPSPWHGKVIGSAMTTVRMLGRVCLRAHGPWGHCHAICWCVGSWWVGSSTPSTALVCPIWPRFPPNLPLASEEFGCVAMERRGSTRDQGSCWMPPGPTLPATAV